VVQNIATPTITSPQPSEQASGEVFKENSLEALAHGLAEQYILSQKVTGEPLLLHLSQHQEKLLNHAYQYYSSAAQEDIT